MSRVGVVLRSLADSFVENNLYLCQQSSLFGVPMETLWPNTIIYNPILVLEAAFGDKSSWDSVSPVFGNFI